MRRILWGLLIGLTGAIAACSGASSAGNGADGNGGTSGSLNLGGSGAGIGAGGSSVVPLGDACAASSQRAAGVPLDIYALLDVSGSMIDNGSTKWADVKAAMKAFVQAPASKGIGIGVQYFPHGSDECSASSYSTPAVQIAPLPGNAQPIINSMNANTPQAHAHTPTLWAEEGAIIYAKRWKTQHPTHVVVVLLATDGDPNDCTGNTVSTVETAAKNGFTGTPSIKTFVIGVGSSLTNLNGIAKFGGTQQAYIVDTGSNTTQQFTNALNAIRGAASLPCTYQIPAPPTGQQLNLNEVNVQFTASSGGQPQLYPQVIQASQCGPSGGWYYDNPTSPQYIKLCPTTCQTVSADPQGQVNVLLGCSTVQQPPS